MRFGILGIPALQLSLELLRPRSVVFRRLRLAIHLGANIVHLIVVAAEKQLQIGDATRLFFGEGHFRGKRHGSFPGLFVESFQLAFVLRELVLQLPDQVALLSDFGGKIVHFGAAIFDDGLKFLHLPLSPLERLELLAEVHPHLAQLAASFGELGFQRVTLLFDLVQFIKPAFEKLDLVETVVQRGSHVVHLVEGVVQLDFEETVTTFDRFESFDFSPGAFEFFVPFGEFGPDLFQLGADLFQLDRQF